MNEQFSCAVLLLDKDSNKVRQLAEQRGIEITSKSKPIALSIKIYTSKELRILQAYFEYDFEFLQMNKTDNFEEERLVFLKTNLKIGGGINLTDVKGFLKHKAPFHKLVKDDFILAGVEMERSIIAGIKGHVCVQKIPFANNQVYAFLLDDSIAENKRFLKYNPNWDGHTQTFYIGQTGIGREARYNQHMSGIYSNTFVRNYGVKPYEKADFTYELAEFFNKKGIQVLVDELRHYQALYYERKLAEELRTVKLGAYSN